MLIIRANRNIVFLLLLTAVFSESLFPVAASEDAPKDAGFRVAVETSLAWPLVPGVNIFSGKVLLPVTGQGVPLGQLTLGFLLRSGVTRDTEGDFQEFGLNLGYRQYLLGGFHVEGALWPSLASLNNNVVTGRAYQSFTLTAEAYTGYTFDISLFAMDWFLIPQIGLGSTVWMSNPWPVSVQESGPFFVANLLFGVKFS